MRLDLDPLAVARVCRLAARRAASKQEIPEQARVPEPLHLMGFAWYQARPRSTEQDERSAGSLPLR